MSVMLFSAKALGAVAYLARARVSDLYAVHQDNVAQWNEYYTHHATQEAEPESAIVAARVALSAKDVERAFVESVLDTIASFRYNVGDTPEVLEACTRIEAEGFRLYRVVLTMGGARTLQAEKEIEEREVFLLAEDSKRRSRKRHIEHK